MAASDDWADYTWLAGEEGRRVMDEASANGEDLLRLSRRLRRYLPAERARLVVDQLVLRRKARTKFSAADRMLFTRKGLEQSTGERIAAYKSGRFPAVAVVADLCCGIGGDLLALAGRGPVVGVDASPPAAICCRANLDEVVGDSRGGIVYVGRGEDARINKMGFWHADPDRRVTGRRVSAAVHSEPAPAVIDAWRRENPHGAVKLAPATVVPPHWAREAELEWISSGRECRQLVAWFGDLARHGGLRCATSVCAGGEPGSPPPSMVGDGTAPLRPATEIGPFLYEPDPAVLAAGLAGDLAARHGLASLTPCAGYLTGETCVEDPLLGTFRVLEILPWNVRRIGQRLRDRGIGRLEIKQRGLRVDVEVVRRTLRTPGRGLGTLVMSRFLGRRVAVLAQRLGGE